MMATKDIENDKELQQILWACHDYWEGIEEASNRAICYSWVLPRYKEKFGTEFHQSRLNRLVSLGYLEKDDTSRGGNRRYYKLANPSQLSEALKKWGLSS